MNQRDGDIHPESGSPGSGETGGAEDAEFVSDEPSRLGETETDVKEFVSNEPSDIGVVVRENRYSSVRMRELVRAGMAILLWFLLAAVTLIIVSATAFGHLSTVDAKDLLGEVMAPLVGLVGAATGFYYGGKK